MGAKLELRRQQKEINTATLQTNVESLIQLRTHIAVLDKERRERSNEILAEADNHGGETETDDFVIKATNGRSPDVISREKLLALGVKLSVIRKATTPGTPYRYPHITDKRKPAKAKGSR